MWYLVQLGDKMLCDRRNSNWCDSKTQENDHGAKWEEGKGKKVQYLINTWIIQDKTIGGGKS